MKQYLQCFMNYCNLNILFRQLTSLTIKFVFPVIIIAFKDRLPQSYDSSGVTHIALLQHNRHHIQLIQYIAKGTILSVVLDLVWKVALK